MMKETKPPVGAKTRWAGIVPMIKWINENYQALCEYQGKHPSDCVPMEDGSHYGDYTMEKDDWDVIMQMVST